MWADLKDFLREWGTVIVALLFVAVIRLFVFEPVIVNGHSMDPTLADGQRLIITKVFNPERFDIITVAEPDDPSTTAVKRLIGLPGDTVKYQDDQLYINGKKYSEEYLSSFKQKLADNQLTKEYAYDKYFSQRAETAATFTNNFETTVPKGKYFVLGDNRLVSKDSRIFGFVSEDQIKGEVVLRYFPLDKMGGVH